jgi:hypothetical protein
VWGLEGCAEGIVEISTARDARTSVGWLLVYRASRLDQVDVTYHGPFRVTTPTRTILDLCSVVPRDEVEMALDDALRRGLTTLPRLRWALRRLGRRGRGGTRVFRELLDERGRGYTPSESPFEARLLRLLVSADLPRPVSQYEVRDRGRLIARVDLAYPRSKLAIEADGYRYHAGKVHWQRNLTRRNH